MNRPLPSVTLQRLRLFCAAPAFCAVGIFCAVFTFCTAPTLCAASALCAAAAGLGESPATVGAAAEPPDIRFYKAPANGNITVNGKASASRQVFAENDDLLLLKCAGIAPIVKPPYNSSPQPDAVDRLTHKHTP